MINKVFNKIKGHPHLTDGTAYAILFTIGTCHLLNDMIQSVIPAIYPLLKEKFGFTFAQIGIITLVFQLTSSVLQPFVGRYADRHPQPYSLAMGMCFTLVGLVSLAFASGFLVLLLSVALIGCGSSVFHPEASRVAQIASGGKKSLAQSIFQVGGNGGRLVCAGSPISLPLADAYRLLVQFGTERDKGTSPPACFPSLHASREDHPHGTGYLGPDDILEILFQCLHDELFHVLPHRKGRLLPSGHCSEASWATATGGNT